METSGSFFSNIRIGYRIGLAFLSVITLLALMGGQSLRTLDNVNSALNKVTRDAYPKVKLLSQIGNAVDAQARYTRNLFIFDNAQTQAQETRNIQQSRESVAALFVQLEPLVQSRTGKELFTAARAAMNHYERELDALLQSLRRGESDTARDHLESTLRPAQLALMEAASKLSEHQQNVMANDSDAAERQVRTGRLATTTIAIVAPLVALLLCWLVARSITRPLHTAVQVAEAVADGNLTSHIPTDRRDEVGQLLAALARMNASLVRIVSNVRLSSDSIVTGSTEIANGNSDLSQRTEEQASNLEETAASMEQLTSTVQQNADSARRAQALASGASNVAAQGGSVVQEVVRTMDEIKQSSSRMSDILGVIDGIAFQTNILALNAAVEAARAGEQGRGFAVVASEVRILAQRSAEAAKEIKGLILDSDTHVQAGSALVEQAGHTMRDIVEQVAQVSTLVAEISAASAEQSSGINQVGDAVQQLDQVTQQNAALVEQSAAAADSLKFQAHALTQAVVQFRLPQDATDRTAVPLGLGLAAS